MFANFFVVICLSLFMNYSFGQIFNNEHVERSTEKNQRDVIIEFENKMKALFSVWKTETNQKLDSLEKMIPDLEKNIDGKLYTLRNSILDELEEFIDSKFNSLERSIPEKLNENVNTMCTSDVLDKRTFETFERKINLKFDILARNIRIKLEGNIIRSQDVLKKVTDLKDIFNQKFEVLDKKIPVKFEENISTRIDAVARNLTNKFEEKYNCTLDNKKATEENEPPQSDENENEFSYKVTNVTHTLDAPAVAELIHNKTELPCKEESLESHRSTPYYSVDNETLNHVTVKRDSAGLLEYFELHVAIQADEDVDIRLTDKVDHSDICVIFIGYGSNQYTSLWYPGTTIQHTHTRNILSPTEFRTFYIRVNNGTLQFGKEGDSTPLISQYIAGLESVNYFWIMYNGDSASKIRYDCPHVPESSSLS